MNEIRIVFRIKVWLSTSPWTKNQINNGQGSSVFEGFCGSRRKMADDQNHSGAKETETQCETARKFKMRN